MYNLIIKKVKQFSKANSTLNVFHFLDRNGVLFELNDKVDECPEGIIKEDVVLYPSYAAEILGIVLAQDQPIPSVEEKIEPQGHAEDAALLHERKHQQLYTPTITRSMKLMTTMIVTSCP